ncbi:MAG: hypothetical protein D6729_12120, partial [Deltaproteobacteria bacterium]
VGLRPDTRDHPKPGPEAAGALLGAGDAPAAVAWLEGDTEHPALVLTRPGKMGPVSEILRGDEHDPRARWRALALALRARLSSPPPEVNTAEHPKATKTTHLSGASPPEPNASKLPELPTPVTAVCETLPVPWWPTRELALRLILAPKLALGGGGLQGTAATGVELRSHLHLQRGRLWLRDLRVLAGLSLAVDTPERVGAGGVRVRLHGRYLLVDAAALLPLASRLERVLLLGPRLALRVGALRAQALATDAFAPTHTQPAVDLSAGVETRLRLRHLEVGASAGLEIPLTRLRVLPEMSVPLWQRQVRLRIDLRAIFPLGRL